MCLATVQDAYAETLSGYLVPCLVFSIFSGVCVAAVSVGKKHRLSTPEVPPAVRLPLPLADVVGRPAMLQQELLSLRAGGVPSSSDGSERSFVCAQDILIE